MAKLKPSMTVREFFNDFYVPMRLGSGRDRKRANTVGSYEQVLSIWEQAMGNLSLEDIDTAELTKFLHYLQQRKYRGKLISDNTIRKHLRHLNAILTFAGPPGRHARDAQSVISVVPWVRSPKQIHRMPVPAKGENIKKLMGVLHHARAPEGLWWPSDWWEAFLRLSLNTGARFSTLVAIEWTHIHPDEIRIPGEIVKSSKPLVVSLHKSTRTAIDRLRGMSSTVLPYEHELRHKIHKENKRLNELAGIPPDEKVTSQSLRRFVITQVTNYSAAAGQSLAGHASFDTTQNHYLGKSVVVDATKSLSLADHF